MAVSLRWLLILAILVWGNHLGAQTTMTKVEEAIGAGAPLGMIRTSIGVTRRGTPIPALITSDDLDFDTPKIRILLVGGLDGSDATARTALMFVRWFYGSKKAEKFRRLYALSAVPIANPDAWASRIGPQNLSGGNPTTGYPPAGDAYSSPANPEAAYLWRWIGMHAPDLVVDIRREQRGWAVPPDPTGDVEALAQRLRAVPISVRDTLVPQIMRGKPSDIGPIPAIELHTTDARLEPLEELFKAMDKVKYQLISPARREMQWRVNREPIDVARDLVAVYGHELDSVVYIPAMALIGRLRLGEIDSDNSQLADVQRIVAPYLEGKTPTLPEKPSSSHLSGHLIFGELARSTGNYEYTKLAQQAADLAFDENGEPLESMPLHNEMSDSVFMGCPILALTGRLAGKPKYFDMAVKHYRFMRNLGLRNDGLFRHSPLDQTAWGRGNGFPALGLALTLGDLPSDHPAYGELRADFQRHLLALLGHQDPTGAWHQVIDFDGSYRELTSTSMILYSMIRGVRSGWLDRERFEPAIDRAWYAVKTRVGIEGNLVDVCESTGKQNDIWAYLDRKAILGKDPRGGAMALLAATEMASWEKEGRP
jgi:rhamnogalacturonyl hydrolase YesR